MTGILGMQRMRWEDRQHRKNREAEEAHARRVAWGAGEMNDDDMGDQIQIGDTQNHFHNGAPRGSGLAKTILSCGLAAAGLGLGMTVPILAWNMTKQPSAEGSDTDTKYGLQFFKEDQ